MFYLPLNHPVKFCLRVKIFSLDQLDDWGDDSFHVKVAAEHFRIIHQVAYRKMVHEKYKLIISNCHKYNFCLEWSKFYSRKLQKNQTIFGICLQGVRSFFFWAYFEDNYLLWWNFVRFGSFSFWIFYITFRERSHL